MKEAEKSLRFYRGIRVDDDSDCELLQIELDKLKIVYSEESRLGRPTEGKKVNAITLDDFKSIEAKKSLLIAFVLVALNQLCGCFAMLNYTATIFAEAGSDLSPNMSAIVVGIIQLIGSCITVMLVDRAGRKVSCALRTFIFQYNHRMHFSICSTVFDYRIGNWHLPGPDLFGRFHNDAAAGLPIGFLSMGDCRQFFIRDIHWSMGRPITTLFDHVWDYSGEGETTLSDCTHIS